MLFVGYFEGIDSQRGIAWRCADSLSLRQFLGTPLSQNTPDHSTLTNTRKRLPQEIFDEVFQFVLKLAGEKKLLAGKTVGVDSTMLEADAAMKTIVRRDTGEDWKEYVTRLMREEGVIAAEEEPSEEEIRRFDRGRKDKKVSNEDWKSPTDDDARIAKLKDGRTHLAYKAEHVVDLESELILSATIHAADHGDADTMEDSLMQAQTNLDQLSGKPQLEEAAADKGYHKAESLCVLAEEYGLRTYIPEPAHKYDRTWTDKPAEQKRAVYNNRRRVRRSKGKRLQRLRSERVERSFAHLCDSGGMRRSRLRGILNVTKRYLIAAAAHNLARVLRMLCGIGKPKALQGLRAIVYLLQFLLNALLRLSSTLRFKYQAPREVIRALVIQTTAIQKTG
jgi:IS5 family transposase